MPRPFLQVDVFGSAPFSGNPLAVVADAEGLSTEQMQDFARWANLSESVFLLPPTAPHADYLVRIFTPARELPFAGHPTLGACHAWLEGGGRPRRHDVVLQECGAGLVPLRRTGDVISFAAPPLVRSGPVDPAGAAEVVSMLGLDPARVVAVEWVDNGPGWIGVLVDEAALVLETAPRIARFEGEGSFDVGVAGLYPIGSECALEVRAFFSDEQGTIREDPVTGSLNASLGQWLLGTGRVMAPYVAAQGTAMGRAGRVHVDLDEEEGTVWVGGATVTVVSGEIAI
jgi:PhzF family phenazine biosynthesis protein